MSDDPEDRTLPVETQHDTFLNELDKQRLANHLFVIQKQLDELLRQQPDKGSVQTTRDMIFQVMSAMANIASKDNMREISQRIGTLESAIGKIGQTSALNERDVSQLKEGQSSIREAVRGETSRLEKSLDERKGELERQIGDLRKELDKQTDGLTKEFEKQTEGLTKELEKQVTSLSTELKESRQAVHELNVDLSNSRTENSRYLLGTLISIVLLVIGVATFVVRGIPDKPSTTVPTATVPAVGAQRGASGP